MKDLSFDKILLQIKSTSFITLSKMSLNIEQQSGLNISETSSITEFELPVRKRVHIRVLNFIRSNYLWIIKIMALTILTLLILIFLFIYLFIASSSYNDQFNSTVLHEVVNKSDTSYLVSKLLVETTTIPDLINQQSYSKFPCKRIHCKRFSNPCNLTNFNYESIKQYSCCGCLNEYSLVRYEMDLLSGTSSILITGGDLDICSASIYDVSALPQFMCIAGSWTVIRESDTTCIFKYGIVHSSCEYYE